MKHKVHRNEVRKGTTRKVLIRRLAVIALLASLVNLSVGCQKREPVTLEQALALYRENKLEQALPLFERLVTQDNLNPVNCVWLAETYRRFNKKEEAIKMARKALELNPRSSFAHTIIAEASNPVVGEWSQANSETTWLHLMQAIECDSIDGHPWLVVWGEAIHRGEYPKAQMALRRIMESGFLTTAALSYGRWMLRALPKDAILLTNGDMDTYPPCAVQEVEGLRRDVTIVNRGTLNESWYARYIRDHGRVPLPFGDVQLDRLTAFKDSQGIIVKPSDQIFRAWLKQKADGSFKRPLAVAVTVDESYWSSAKNNMRNAGAFLLWQDPVAAKTPDSTSMRASLEGLKPDDFFGQWVSDQDRSPIRRMYTKNLVRNVTETAIMCSELLFGAKRYSEANRWVRWADDLDRKAEAGPVFRERITKLMEKLSRATREGTGGIK